MNWSQKLSGFGTTSWSALLTRWRGFCDSGANISKNLLKQSLLCRSLALCGSHFKWRVVMAYLSPLESIGWVAQPFFVRTFVFSILYRKVQLIGAQHSPDHHARSCRTQIFVSLSFSVLLLLHKIMDNTDHQLGQTVNTPCAIGLVSNFNLAHLFRTICSCFYYRSIWYQYICP